MKSLKYRWVFLHQEPGESTAGQQEITPLCGGNTRLLHVYPEPPTSRNISRKIAPHFSTGLGDIFICNIYVKIGPQPFQPPEFFWSVTFFSQRLRELENLLLFVWRQVAKFFKDLLLDSHGGLS